MTRQIVRAASRVGAALLLCAAAHAAPHYVVTAVRVTDLGTVGGPIASANDINDRGDIVGWSFTAGGAEHAFLFTGGLMTDIGPSISKGWSAATGINNAGQVVSGCDLRGDTRAVRWDLNVALLP
jgi:probable HAF family extracellular repeat protein